MARGCGRRGACGSEILQVRRDRPFGHEKPSVQQTETAAPVPPAREAICERGRVALRVLAVSLAVGAQVRERPLAPASPRPRHAATASARPRRVRRRTRTPRTDAPDLPATGDLDNPATFRPRLGLHPPLREPERGGGALKAQQIQVGAALVWGEGYDNDTAFFTAAPPISTPDFILHYDSRFSISTLPDGASLLRGLIRSSTRRTSSPCRSRRARRRLGRKQPRAIVGMAMRSSGRKTARFRFARRLLRPWKSSCTRAWPPGFSPWSERSRRSRKLPSVEGAAERGLSGCHHRASDWSCLAQRFAEDTLGPTSSSGAADLRELAPSDQGRRTAAASASVTASTCGSKDVVWAKRFNLPVPRKSGYARDAGRGGRRRRSRERRGFRPGAGCGWDPVAQARVGVQSSWIAARSPYVLTSPVFVWWEGGPSARRPTTSAICGGRRAPRGPGWDPRLKLWDSKRGLRAYREAIAEVQRRFARAAAVLPLKSTRRREGATARPGTSPPCGRGRPASSCATRAAARFIRTSRPLAASRGVSARSPIPRRLHRPRGRQRRYAAFP